MGRWGYTYNWSSAESDVLIATPLTLPPWIGLGMRCSGGLTLSNSIYHVVLDPSNYPKFVRLLFGETSEPDALNRAMNRIVKPTRHLRNDPLVPSPSLFKRILNFVTVHRVELTLRSEGLE